MTLLSHNSCHSGASEVWKCVSSIGGRLSRLLNRWVAAFLARREYQATLAVLHRLSDRELKDMGLYRGLIERALEDAAKDRVARRKP